MSYSANTASDQSTLPPVPSGSGGIINPQAAQVAQAIQPTSQPQQQPQQTQTTQPQPIQFPADSQAELHQHLFKHVLQTMAGQKRLVPDPDNPGQMKVEYTGGSKKSIAAGVLAGAISGMLAGMSAPRSEDKWGHRDLAPSVAASAQAAERQMQTAQRMSDEEAARVAANFHLNIQKHVAVLNSTKLQGDVMKDQVNIDAPIFEALSLNAEAAAGMKTDLTGEQLQKLLQTDPQHFQRSNALVTDLVPVYDANGKPVMNPDGTPRMDYKYAIFNNDAVVHMSDNLRNAFPQLKDVANGQALPVRVLANYGVFAANKQNSDAAVAKWVKEYNDLIDQKKIKGEKLDLATVQQKIASNPSLSKNLPAMLQSYSGRSILSIDNMSKDAEAGHIDRSTYGAFINALGIDTDQLADYRKSQERLGEKTMTPDTAAQILADDKETPERKKTAQAFLDQLDKREEQKLERVEASKIRLEQNKQDEKDARTPVYAVDANGQTIISNLYEHPEGEQVKPSDVFKDRAAMRQLNDVQTNVNRYRQAIANDLPKVTATDRDNMQELFALNQQAGGNLISVGAQGFSLNSLPVIGAKLTKKNYEQATKDLAALSPSARNMMNGYLRIAAAVPAYQKALTNIGRTNKEMLDLELANVPMPYYDANTIVSRTEAFQENVDQAASGFPTNLPGMDKVTSSPGQTGQAQGGPPASMLKEGVNTTFKNGQVWTLQNGQPVRVK